MRSKTAAIIGGGVAGIACATALADAGVQVTLLEKRPLLGGRASSYIDSQTGARLDECQHGTMRCCTNLAKLLDTLGVHDKIAYHNVIEFLDGDGKRSVIAGSGLPAPLHTAPSFLRFRSLGVRDKIAIGRGMMTMLRAKPDAKRDEISVEAWFRAIGQTERAIKRFWEPIIVSACNESLDRVSCAHAFKLFRDGFLRNACSFEFGIPTVPLGTLYTEPTVAYLNQRGGCIRTRTIVDKICFEGGPNGSVAGLVLQDGEEIRADAYISALQFDLLLKLLPPDVTNGVPYWENLREIELTPIIGIHLWFDRPLDCPAALALLDRETDWIFYKNKNFAANVDQKRQEKEQVGADNASPLSQRGTSKSGELPGVNASPLSQRGTSEPGEGKGVREITDEGAYLSIVISAPGRLSSLPKEELLQIVVDDVRACVPDARTANIVRSRVITWPKATIAPKPGIERLRPDQRSPISNLLVAGEWTQTGWPSTMEGAARSGYRAAEYLLASWGNPQMLVAPDLPAAPLFRFLDGQR